jgi:hypothetical protein
MGVLNWAERKPQISPLRYAPVEMTNLLPGRAHSYQWRCTTRLTNLSSRSERSWACGRPKGMKTPSVRRPFSIEASRSPWSSLNPNNRSPMEAPPSPCHPEEPTCLRQVKGEMSSTGHRGLDGCPMFAPANVGRKRRAKPPPTLLVGPGYGCSLGAQPRDLQFYGPFKEMFFCFRQSVLGFPVEPMLCIRARLLVVP